MGTVEYKRNDFVEVIGRNKAGNEIMSELGIIDEVFPTGIDVSIVKDGRIIPKLSAEDIRHSTGWSF